MLKVTFTVEGGGTFPYDMLRFDYCYPVTARDSQMLDNGEYQSRRKVKLGSERPPTPARWESFNWKVIEIHETA